MKIISMIINGDNLFNVMRNILKVSARVIPENFNENVNPDSNN